MARAFLALLLAACGGAAHAPNDAPIALGSPNEVAVIEVLVGEIERIESAAPVVASDGCYLREIALAAADCRPAAAVCDRSRGICLRSDRLGDHPWASEQCRESRASCKKQRCQCVKRAGTAWR